jgi:hypothetical protein
MNIGGRSIKLFFVDGRPDGMLTAEVFNWTGHVLRTPRTQLRQARSRAQAHQTGVYVLLGDQNARPKAYIGEAEKLSKRLKEHAGHKDWWDTAVLVTTGADSLHKAHGEYLESRLVEIAKNLNFSGLENANIPPKSNLSEADISNMESFLETLQIVLPAIRVNLFIDKSTVGTPASTADPGGLPVFELKKKKFNLHATAILRQGELIVQAGGRARSSWVGDTKQKTYYHKLYTELSHNGTLQSQVDHGVFTKDYAYSSPNVAGAIVNCRSTNGRTKSKLVSDGRTYADWENDRLTQEVDPS